MSTTLKKIFLAVIPLAGLLFMAPSAFAKKHHHRHHHCWNDNDRSYYDRSDYDQGWYGRNRYYDDRYDDDYDRRVPRYRQRYDNSYYGENPYPGGNPYYGGDPYSSSPATLPWWSVLIPRY